MTAVSPFSAAKRQPYFKEETKNVFNMNMLNKNKYIE